MKTEIIPAILPKDFADLEDKIALVQGLTKNVQIDICDGQFVPNATWPYKKQDDSFEKILSEEIGMPGWEQVNFEIDLMVNHPEKIVEDWIRSGAQRIIIHAEAKGEITEALRLLKNRVEIGIAFNIDTDVHPILSTLSTQDRVPDFIQCMGIDHIGFQGQNFNTKVIEKVKDLRIDHPTVPISIDGGVSLDTAPLLIQAGVNRLVIGSAIFATDNPIEALQKFKNL